MPTNQTEARVCPLCVKGFFRNSFSFFSLRRLPLFFKSDRYCYSQLEYNMMDSEYISSVTGKCLVKTIDVD